MPLILCFFAVGIFVCSWIGNLAVGHDSRLYVCLCLFLFLFGFIVMAREYLSVSVLGSFLLSMFLDFVSGGFLSFCFFTCCLYYGGVLASLSVPEVTSLF